MKKIIGLVIIISLFFLGTVSGRQLEWPEGWSEEHKLGQFSIFSQRFGAAFDQKEDTFFIAGLAGSRGNMQVVVDIFRPEAPPEHLERFIIRDGVYFADFPMVFIGSGEKIIVSWLEEIDRIRFLKYKVLNKRGEILGEETILQSPRRITNVYGKEDARGRLHLSWTGLGETGLEIHYARISEAGFLEMGPVQLTASNKFSYRGLVIAEEDFLNLFWIELHSFSADLQYRRFTMEGEPLAPVKTVAHVSLMDRAGLPVLEIYLDADLDKKGNIHLVWNAQGDGDALFRSGSDIFYARFKDGIMEIKPHNLVAYWADAHRAAIRAGEERVHIAWEDHLRSPVRISYISWDELREVPPEPVNLNIGTNSAFSPVVFLDRDANPHLFWYNFFQDQRMIEIKTINNRFPAQPSFWYRVGLGTENPFQRLSYILGLNFFLSLLNSLTQFHFLAVLLLILGYIGRFFDLRPYAWWIILSGFAFIFLLQETGWYYTPFYVNPGMEFLNAGLAGFLASIYIRTFKDWPGIRDAVGQFIVFWLFIYWQTFFSFIPHYIQDIIP